MGVRIPHPPLRRHATCVECAHVEGWQNGNAPGRYPGGGREAPLEVRVLHPPLSETDGCRHSSEAEQPVVDRKVAGSIPAGGVGSERRGFSSKVERRPEEPQVLVRFQEPTSNNADDESQR